jgi:hypothetical protein
MFSVTAARGQQGKPSECFQTSKKEGMGEGGKE